MTEEEYRVALRSCRDRVKKAKDNLELNLVRDGKGDRRGFYNYIHSRNKT